MAPVSWDCVVGQSWFGGPKPAIDDDVYDGMTDNDCMVMKRII